MKSLLKIAAAVAANIFGLWLAARFIPHVFLSGNFTELLTVGIVLTALNLIIKPLLKLLLGPVIVITLGLGVVLVNMIILLILDILFQNLSIVGVAPLIYASLLLSAVNLIFHAFTKN
ncbi:MAG: hypothetical protein A2946_00910 [Candidatus Liptonbacteria bacterium RIFCSPLOWO2_01_FULL_53_13]|uniref:Phage holin family protein n=1 Tax=Candidatus Liptonbacteria bacterium RIFCSPLOWO2_01_FULL_53_13 TaxID=1798651 RepID=A0A1G2CJ39_9BACT|nr:MAG: hypothetical protein A2946_00910 [Candidatus Liptonbacteria bacterium RIFCSPLOWO2_01_FULL_53_13]